MQINFKAKFIKKRAWSHIAVHLFKLFLTDLQCVKNTLTKKTSKAFAQLKKLRTFAARKQDSGTFSEIKRNGKFKKKFANSTKAATFAARKNERKCGCWLREVSFKY